MQMPSERHGLQISGGTFASSGTSPENEEMRRASSDPHDRRPMRSFFPALQDRFLATLLWTALAVLGAMVCAAAVGGSDVEAASPEAEEVPPQFVFGATPAQ